MVQRWSNSLSLSLVFVSETILNSLVSEDTKRVLDFDGAVGVDSEGTSDGLCLYRRTDLITFSLVSMSSHHIC